MFDHNAIVARFKNLSDDALNYVIKDCHEAIAANPDNPKCGEYTDTALYAAQELHNRKDFIVGDPKGRHVEITVNNDGSFDPLAILFIRPDGEKVIARSFASRKLKTRRGTENAAIKWLLRNQANQIAN